MASTFPVAAADKLVPGQKPPTINPSPIMAPPIKVGIQNVLG